MFTRSGGKCVAHFEPTEAAVLHTVVIEVMALLTEEFDHGDPVVQRLFPDMYPEDPTSSADLRRYTEDDLREGKLEQAAALLDDLPRKGGSVALPGDRSEMWLRTLTDVRLALGTRLNVTDDTDIEAELDEAVFRDPTSAQVGDLSVYAYLSFLQGSLVEALMG